mmetsp:Transcript_118809/g.296263  ORF Transcript_118809/g.296263 Transcript_118809/m.296263 type:complete len:589 (+) Transcript_118809:66-1832(+)
MADQTRKDGVKFGAVNQTVLAQGQMDMSGFRIGKQRLVSKKKKKSNLKKVILEERDFNKARGAVGMAAAQPADGSANNTVSNVLSLDAPEFLPIGWDLGPLGSSQAAREETPAAGETAAAGAAAGVVGGATAGPTAAVRSTEAPDVRKLPLASPPPIFVPSWCQGLGDNNDSNAEPPGDGGGGVDDLHSGPGAASSAGAGGAEVADSEARHVGQAFAEAASDAARLRVSEALQRLSETSKQEQGKKKQAEKKVAQAPKGADLEVRHYVHQVLSDDLDDKVKAMLGELVRFQERAKERDPLKYQKQKRFCVGMREARRSVARGKAKGIICAPNLEECSAEGGLDDTVEDLIEACRDAEVPVIFALSRNRIGKALGKNIRLSIVCILSAEGVHQEFKQVLKMTDDLRRQWVIRQMENFDPADAEAARHRAEEKAARDAERREAKAKAEAERKAEEERQRAEAKAAKEAEKARRQAAHQAEMERRRAAKAAREQAAREAEAEAEVTRREEEKRKAEEEKRRAATEQAERAKREAQQRIAEQERQRKAAAAAAEAAKAKAAAVAAGEDNADEDSDSDSSASSVPLGFNAALF